MDQIDSVVEANIGHLVQISCTSRGSPPDTFTWMKDGVPITESATNTITTITHDNTSAVFRSDLTINRFLAINSGTYTCTVTNPIGSDSKNITVTIRHG